MSGARQYAARVRDQRKHVTRLDDVPRSCARRTRDANGVRAIGGRDARGHTFGRLDRNGEVGPVHRAVHRRHGRELQLARALFGDRHADEAASETRHEIDDLGRDGVGGDDEVAFVLAIFLVDQDDDTARAQLADDFGNRAHRLRQSGWRGRRVYGVQSWRIHNRGGFIVSRTRKIGVAPALYCAVRAPRPPVTRVVTRVRAGARCAKQRRVRVLFYLARALSNASRQDSSADWLMNFCSSWANERVGWVSQTPSVDPAARASVPCQSAKIARSSSSAPPHANTGDAECAPVSATATVAPAICHNPRASA